MSSRDDDDLFGDGDCGGSLFGDDDDSLFGGPDDDDPLFRGADDDKEEQATRLCASMSDATGGSAVNYLSLPSVPDPHDALSCSHVGLTSGQHTVSTQDPSGNVWDLPMPETTSSETTVDAQVFRDQAIDTFPVASHHNGDQADHERQEETACQSPGPSPSKDGLMQDLERMLEEEFAQDQCNHDQPDLPNDLSAAIRPATQPTDDDQMLMEYNILQHQAARATTTALGDQPAHIGISLAETDHRWAKAASRRGIRLPRRIDFDGADVGVLRPYLTLSELSQSSPPFIC